MSRPRWYRFLTGSTCGRSFVDIRIEYTLTFHLVKINGWLDISLKKIALRCCTSYLQLDLHCCQLPLHASVSTQLTLLSINPKSW